MSPVRDEEELPVEAPERSRAEPLPGAGSLNPNEKDTMIATRAGEAAVGPAAGSKGIASIFQQFELDSVTRPAPGPADPEKLMLGNLSKEAPALDAPQLQSATIGWTQMLQMLGASSGSIPPMQLGGGPAALAVPPAAQQLPQPSPLYPRGRSPAPVADPHERAPPAASPFTAPTQLLEPRSDAALGNTDDVFEGRTAPRADRTARRAKLRAQVRAKDDADADWEMEEEEAEPEWKEPMSRNTKEPKVNVRFDMLSCRQISCRIPGACTNMHGSGQGQRGAFEGRVRVSGSVASADPMRYVPGASAWTWLVDCNSQKQHARACHVCRFGPTYTRRSTRISAQSCRASRGTAATLLPPESAAPMPSSWRRCVRK